MPKSQVPTRRPGSGHYRSRDSRDDDEDDDGEQDDEDDRSPPVQRRPHRLPPLQRTLPSFQMTADDD